MSEKTATRPTISYEDFAKVDLRVARVVEAVRAHAPVAEAEVIGLPPETAFAGFPDDLPVRNRRTLEQALAAHAPIR